MIAVLFINDYNFESSRDVTVFERNAHLGCQCLSELVLQVRDYHSRSLGLEMLCSSSTETCSSNLANKLHRGDLTVIHQRFSTHKMQLCCFHNQSDLFLHASMNVMILRLT
jgi:hypothetical protein